MALFRPAFAILLALVGSTAEAGPQAVPRKYQAGFYLDGCKDFLAGRKAGLPPGLGSAPSGFRPILARPPGGAKGGGPRASVMMCCIPTTGPACKGRGASAVIYDVLQFDFSPHGKVLRNVLRIAKPNDISFRRGSSAAFFRSISTNCSPVRAVV
jgi:hypothetical protein